MGTMLLVRHGQASFGSADYDQLSPLGERQSEALGVALGEARTEPILVVHGELRRQRDTARRVSGAAHWSLPSRSDARWDEFDAAGLIAASGPLDPRARVDSRMFQKSLERAAYRWAAGDHDGEYAETFDEFCARVDAAFDAVAAKVSSGGTAVVFTSSGVLAWVAARLIKGGVEQWIALNRVTLNAGATKVVVGASGNSLVSFNDHSHLPSDLLTYR